MPLAQKRIQPSRQTTVGDRRCGSGRAARAPQRCIPYQTHGQAIDRCGEAGIGPAGPQCPFIEDLGHCHLKNIEAPLRAYRLGPHNIQPSAPESQIKLRPTLAVIPFALRGGGMTSNAAAWKAPFKLSRACS